MQKHALPGLFIVFDGIDGTGKTTQKRLLVSYLQSAGYDVCDTFEPTNGQFGRQIRAAFTKRHTLSADAELELFLLDRQEHLQQKVLPALQQAQIVVCDRYVLSTLAYQSNNSRSVAELLERHAFAIQPDLCFLLDLSPAESQSRIQHATSRTTLLNDFETSTALQHARRVFLTCNFSWIVRLAAAQPIDNLQLEIRQCLQQRFPEKLRLDSASSATCR